MKGNPTSTRDLRRERLVGNWGGASDHIGRRWEELGLEFLHSNIASGAPWPGNHHQPRDLVPLAGNDGLQAALSRSGLPSPDVIVVLQGDEGSSLLQALDFKWNVEFASYSQIRAEAVRALLERGIEPLESLLSKALDERPQELPILDGLLCAPDLPVNQWFLYSENNLRQEYPIEAQEVVFVEVDPFHFFGGLPGWEMAGLLARLDRSEPKLQNLEGSEHYYRIGAGLLSATAQLQASVFVRQPPSVQASVAFDWLRDRVRPAISEGFVSHAEKLMATRSQLQARLRNVAKSPYRFLDLVEALKGRNLQLPEREDGLPPRDREQWGNLLRQVAVEHRELVYRTGLRLIQAGLSDAEALARLEGDLQRFADRTRAHGDRLIAAALA